MRRVAMSLVVGTSLGVPFALGWYHATQRAGDYRFGSQNPLWAYACLGMTLLLCATVLGIPDEPSDWQPAIGSAVAASLIAGGVSALVLVVFPGLLPRFVLLAAPVLVVPFNTAASMLSIRNRRRRARNDRVFALLGADEAAFLINEATMDFPRPEVAFQLVEVVETRLPTATSGSVGDIDMTAFGRDVARAEATLLVISDRLRDDEQVVAAAARLHADGVRVRTLEAFSDHWLGKLPVSALSHLALMTDIGDVHGGPYRHIKRMLDLVAALVLAVVGLAVLPFVLVGNAIANRGPLLYRQERVGHHGSTFGIVKFRTMTPTAVVDTSWTRLDDPRITRFGRILRRTHLDELPQAWNIIRGDLSIVGPRPEQPGYVAELRTKLPFYDMRHVVQPGLTGWAQVKYRYAATEADALEKLQYDLYYLRHQSLTLDLRILSRTVRSIIRRRGR